MNFESAVHAHVEWKMKLRSAIKAQTELDEETIAKDNCCRLGQWLHGEAKVKYGRLAAYQEWLAAHAAFHREAGIVAGLINDKCFSEAEAALASGTPYYGASMAAGVALNKLKDAVDDQSNRPVVERADGAACLP